MYKINEFVALAKRENNTKRSYVVVNPLQGKHFPVSPRKSLLLFHELGFNLAKKYQKESTLVIGFAETATAISSAVAISTGSHYIQTTRETYEGAEYLYFTEEHSHATTQKIIRNELDKIIDKIDRIIFVEDEVTTGNTILNIINLLEKTYDTPLKFAVASILNAMNEEAINSFETRNIDLNYIAKLDHSEFSELVSAYENNGEYLQFLDGCDLSDLKISDYFGYINARYLTSPSEYSDKCKILCNQFLRANMCTKKDILVLGTEEFMYPAICIASYLEKTGNTVHCHSTTRSPIVCSTDENYPLNSRCELRSLYEDERKIFLYNLRKYDKVYIITDAENLSGIGMQSLISALKHYENDDIEIIRWCNDAKFI